MQSAVHCFVMGAEQSKSRDKDQELSVWDKSKINVKSPTQSQRWESKYRSINNWNKWEEERQRLVKNCIFIDF